MEAEAPSTTSNLAVKLEQIVKKYSGASPHPLDLLGELATPRSFPGGAHVAEVEIDPETGVIAIPRYAAVDDCGRVLNHVLLEGQRHGGIIQGMGQVMGEHCIYDASGRILTGSFMDYNLPRALAVLDALRPLGIHHLDLPNTPAPVWAAIAAAKRQESRDRLIGRN